MITTLVGKELHHHGPALVGALVLMAALLGISVSFAFINESDTLLTAATGFAYYSVPFLVLFLVRRLIVLEYEQHTYDFLAALPVSAWTRVSVKYVLGLSVTLVVGLVATWVVALLVHRQELISLGWLLQVSAQVGLYLFAWFGVTFGAAHLGSYRFAFWLTVFPVAFAIEEVDPSVWHWLMWHAVLADSVDVTRFAPPVSGGLVTLAWALIGSAVGLSLGTIRAGSVADELYRPMPTHTKASVFLVVVGTWMATDVVAEVVEPGGPTYTGLRNVGTGETVVRVASAGELAEAGRELARTLDALSAVVGGPWPAVVLVRTPQRADEPVTVRSRAHDELVLEVSEDVSRWRILHDALGAALDDRSAGFAAYRDDRAWVLVGLPAWWLGPDPEQPDALGLAAAYGASAGMSDPYLTSHLGPQALTGVAWAGLTSVAELGGEAAVYRIAAQAFGAESSATLLGLMAADRRVGGDLLSDASGLDRSLLEMAWSAELARLQVLHGPTLARIVPRWGSLERRRGEEADVLFATHWNGPPPADLVVQWAALDPLEALPRLDELDDAPVRHAEDLIFTSLDARTRVAVGFALPVPEVGGELWSGLEVDP